jgi:hypothetical protein
MIDKYISVLDMWKVFIICATHPVKMMVLNLRL